MSELSNVTAARVSLRLQRGATEPKPAFRFRQTDGTYLDLTTVHAVHLWIRNQAKAIVLRLVTGDGLSIMSPEGFTDNSLLVIDDEIQLPPTSGYTYDVKIFLTEVDYFFIARGPVEVVEYISE